MVAVWTIVVAAVVLTTSRAQDLPDIWTVVEGSYDSHVMVTFPNLVSHSVVVAW